MATFTGTTTITTELIQQYLDENKQLILAILDNQNLGKLNECAQYQTRLQQNLMYLAAIADAQPQAPQPQQVASPAPTPQQYAGQQAQLQPKQPQQQLQPSGQSHIMQQQQQQQQQPQQQQQRPPVQFGQQQVSQPPDQQQHQHQQLQQQQQAGQASLTTDGASQQQITADMGVAPMATDGPMPSVVPGNADTEQSYLKAPDEAGS